MNHFVWYTWGMKSKLSVVTVIVLSIAGALVTFYFYVGEKEQDQRTRNYFDTRESTDPKIVAVFNEKTTLVERLAQNPVLVEAAEKSNEANKNISDDEILVRDKIWSSSSDVEMLINEILTNEASLVLQKFRKENSEFPEVFLTDMFGLVVASTNKTTDYYQADEQWWVNTYDNGVGKACVTPIEYDESAQSGSVSVCVPVYNKFGRFVGILKAVLAVSGIQDAL